MPTRDIPKQPWGKILAGVAVGLVLGVAALEANARRIGLHAGDLDNSEVAWVKERIHSESAAVAIVGDSRILFDTDLDRFEALTGARPVQLAIHGTSALTLLEDAADNPNFKGLLIVGLADTMFFQPFDGYGGYVRRRDDFTSPSGRVGIEIDHVLQRRLAFLDSNYRLSVARAPARSRISVPASKAPRTISGSCRKSASAARPGCGRASNMILPGAPAPAGRGRDSRRNSPTRPS